MYSQDTCKYNVCSNSLNIMLLFPSLYFVVYSNKCNNFLLNRLHTGMMMGVVISSSLLFGKQQHKDNVHLHMNRVFSTYNMVGTMRFFSSWLQSWCILCTRYTFAYAKVYLCTRYTFAYAKTYTCAKHIN